MSGFDETEDVIIGTGEGEGEDADIGREELDAEVDVGDEDE